MRDRIKIFHKEDPGLIISFPELFAASAGDFKGEIDLQWDPVREASSYIINISLHSENLNWVQLDVITKSSYTITGLKSGRRYCFRVSAVNCNGNGPWSEIVSKLVP